MGCGAKPRGLHCAPVHLGLLHAFQYTLLLLLLLLGLRIPFISINNQCVLSLAVTVLSFFLFRFFFYFLPWSIFPVIFLHNIYLNQKDLSSLSVLKNY